MSKTIQQKISVTFEFPVVFTHDVFAPDNPALRSLLTTAISDHPHPVVMVFMEESVAAALPGLGNKVTSAIQGSCPGRPVILHIKKLPGGEGVKSSPAALDQLIGDMADARVDRHGLVMAIGGGALLDVVGYAASLVHRGVRVIRLPTTTLAQGDGGVGVKTAINHPAGKNFLGTFAPPFAVVNDSSFLPSLPDQEWRAGIAEAFKVALIKEASFFEWLGQNTRALARRDLPAMEVMIARCAELHLNHIRNGGDPFEMGRARPLDFGHWSAHQLEWLSDYQVGHGQAVAIGILLDTIYARRMGWVADRVVNDLCEGLSACGFWLWHQALECRYRDGRWVILDGLEKFREHLGGRLCITVPTGIGQCMEVSSVDETIMESSLMELRERTAVASR